ncbi:MAG: CinA family protein, partial [Pseudomonadota bacterium]|nr:CinA family protein [Pseudomonadota bacterium]
MFKTALIDKTSYLLDTCKRLDISLTTAESCTGGMISALLTEIPGSSASLH